MVVGQLGEDDTTHDLPPHRDVKLEQADERTVIGSKKLSMVPELPLPDGGTRRKT